MHVTFYGAVREVTGSSHLFDNGVDRILLDCGMYQGRRRQTEEKNKSFHFDPRLITNVVLSHAHIDHSGRIPLLTKENFSGRIFATRATADACRYLLPDSAGIQESDAQYVNYKTVKTFFSQIKTASFGKQVTHQEISEIRGMMKSNKVRLNEPIINELIRQFRLEAVSPLYTQKDAEEALTYFQGQPYRSPITIGEDTTCTFYDAGHILGSALSVIKSRTNGRRATVLFTGDIGRYDSQILRNPCNDFLEEDRDIDLLIMESTYGDRLHEPLEDMLPMLEKVLKETYSRGGSVIIPSFAFGRTQELVYSLHEIYERGSAPKVPIYVDSPLAKELTQVYGEHPEVYDSEAKDTFLKKGLNPFLFNQIHFIDSVEQSMELNRDQRPHVVISASGMCEAGRILHHLRHKIHDERNTILIVGYMADNTLGRRIHDLGLAYEGSGRTGAPPIVKFFNKEYPLRAHVVKLGGFSAHGDRDELLRFVKDSNLRIKRIAVVHGEESQSLAFADTLRKNGYEAMVPRVGETLRL
jgi:metallo-beta-lactamase family protein